MPEGFTRQSFSMPPLMLADLKEEALRRDMTLSQLIRELVRNRTAEPHGGLDLRREEGSNGH